MPLLVIAGVFLMSLIGGLLWAPFGRNLVTPQPTPTPKQDVFAIAAGTCLAELETGWEDELPIADCAGEHEGVVLGAVSVDTVLDLTAAAATPTASPAEPTASASGPVWPGDTALAERAMLACERSEMWQDAVDSEWIIVTRWPREAEWDAGARDYLCIARVTAAVVPTPSVSTPAPTG